MVSDRAVIHNYGLKTTNVERRSILSKEYHIKKKVLLGSNLITISFLFFFVENEGNAFFSNIRLHNFKENVRLFPSQYLQLYICHISINP